MENSLQRFSPYYQPPFYTMISPHTQGANLVPAQSYDPCCMQAGLLPYAHGYSGRAIDFNPYIYHHTNPCVDMQPSFASFEGKP